MFEARRRLYADYLGDLATTRNAIRLVARGFHAEGVPRLQPASEAFTGVNPYSRRYQISIVSAPETVVIAATNTFRKLRELRDVVAAGHDPTSDAYAEGRVGYEDSLQGLVRVMRQDLAPVTSLR